MPHSLPALLRVRLVGVVWVARMRASNSLADS